MKARQNAEHCIRRLRIRQLCCGASAHAVHVKAFQEPTKLPTSVPEMIQSTSIQALPFYVLELRRQRMNCRIVKGIQPTHNRPQSEVGSCDAKSPLKVNNRWKTELSLRPTPSFQTQKADPPPPIIPTLPENTRWGDI